MRMEHVFDYLLVNFTFSLFLVECSLCGIKLQLLNYKFLFFSHFSYLNVLSFLFDLNSDNFFLIINASVVNLFLLIFFSQTKSKCFIPFNSRNELVSFFETF